MIYNLFEKMKQTHNETYSCLVLRLFNKKYYKNI